MTGKWKSSSIDETDAWLVVYAFVLLGENKATLRFYTRQMSWLLLLFPQPVSPRSPYKLPTRAKYFPHYIIWHKKSQLPKQKNNTTVILTFFSNLELELWRCKTRPRACQCFACGLLQPVPRKQHLSLSWGKTNDAKLAQGKSCTWLYFQLNWGIYLQLHSYHNFHT